MGNYLVSLESPPIYRLSQKFEKYQVGNNQQQKLVFVFFVNLWKFFLFLDVKYFCLNSTYFFMKNKEIVVILNDVDRNESETLEPQHLNKDRRKERLVVQNLFSF